VTRSSVEPQFAWDRLLALRQRPVVAAATSLFGSTMITSLLGFAFWVAAARLYSAADVGTASAGISAMQFLATVGVLGLGTLVIGEVRHHARGSGLIAAAAIAATTASMVAALLYVLVAPLIHAHLGPMGRGFIGPVLFVGGVGVTGLTIVIDQACIGLLHGGLQFWRNAVFASVKLVLLPVGALMHTPVGALLVYGAWALGNVVSLVTFFAQARRLGLRPSMRPHWNSLRVLRGAALSHHWLNLSSAGPRLILPVLVTSMLGPAQNAAFYAALLVVNFANIVPIHLSTALFSLARGATDALARESRHTLRLSFIVAVVSALIFLPTSHLILRLMGTDYLAATSSMMVLGLTTLPLLIKVHYIAVCRVQDLLNRCAVVITLGGLLELVLAATGASLGGLVGVALGYLLALMVQAVLLWPTVARAADVPLLMVGHARHHAQSATAGTEDQR
jgi:O-antigen/teichoic acid export membrane protein